MNSNLFRAKMTLRGESLDDVAKIIGKRRETTGRKVRDGSFTQPEIKKIIIAWDLSPQEAGQIFFS